MLLAGINGLKKCSATSEGANARMRETALERAERHIRECRERIARQNALLAKLENAGYVQEAARARELLTLLEERLQLTREHLALVLWFAGG